jgi:hypothetical protein
MKIITERAAGAVPQERATMSWLRLRSHWRTPGRPFDNARRALRTALWSGGTAAHRVTFAWTAFCAATVGIAVRDNRRRVCGAWRAQRAVPDAVRDHLARRRDLSARSLAIANDGRTIVFAGTNAGVRRLYARTLDDPVPRVLAGTEGALRVAISPDSRWVLFSASDNRVNASHSPGERGVWCDRRSPRD